ncbi:MAG TPA: hypothetical protein PLE74_01365 [Candidatus Cloacimonadota bacterium]|nr:hypothetical protein [Candidatus Cloacimonadota bacterium]
MVPKLKVIDESPTGLNREFEYTPTGEHLTRGQVADLIDRGKIPGYHNMHVERDGRTYRIPRSNPDSSTKNNLD